MSGARSEGDARPRFHAVDRGVRADRKRPLGGPGLTLNTPQFGWIKSLPRTPQPVPPIFPPEVAAKAIHWAAHHDHREVYVGMPTVKAIVGDKLMPGVLDRYLARIGYKAQQTNQRAAPDRPHNLWKPLPGDRGAHGAFDHRAISRSLQLWTTMNRGWLALLGATLPAGAVMVRTSPFGRRRL